jgi:3-oxoacyl-[acyl-carrier protein] reductase
MKKLEGKVAIISGSGRGIGREIALKLASEGARVVVNDLDAAPAKKPWKAIRAAGGQALACVGSVTDADFGERFVAAAVRLRRAGHHRQQRRLHLGQRDPEDDRRAVGSHPAGAPDRALPHPARGAAEFIRSAAKRKPRPARRCSARWSTSRRSGVMGNAGQANYATAKAGINGLTKALAKEWGRYKVNVNSVAFGLIKTRLTEHRRGRCQHRHRGPRDQGRRQSAGAEECRSADPARPRAARRKKRPARSTCSACPSRTMSAGRC